MGEKNWGFQLVTGPTFCKKKTTAVLAVNTVRHAGQPIQVVPGHLILLRLLCTIQKPLTRLGDSERLAPMNLTNSSCFYSQNTGKESILTYIQARKKDSY